MAALPLFESQSEPLEVAVDLLERQLHKKCETYHVTFGIFKGKKGLEDHNAMIVITDKSGKHYNTTFPAKSFSEMFRQVNELLLTINP